MGILQQDDFDYRLGDLSIGHGGLTKDGQKGTSERSVPRERLISAIRLAYSILCDRGVWWIKFCAASSQIDSNLRPVRLDMAFICRATGVGTRMFCFLSSSMRPNARAARKKSQEKY